MNINLFIYIPFFRAACSDLSTQYLLKPLPLFNYNGTPLSPKF